MTTITTNTPRPGESEEATQARTSEGREEFRQRDPGLSSLSLVERQVTTLLDSSTDSIVHELTQLRDEIDDTIRTFQDQKRKLVSLVAGYTAAGDNANHVKTVVADAMRDLQSSLASQGAEISKLVNGKTQS